MTTNAKGNRIEYHFWDYDFEWTDEHRPAAELDPWTRTCDTLSDECNEILNTLPAPADDPSKRDRYALLRDNYEQNPKLKELWTQINTVPEWVDWDQIQRGQDLYWRYLIPVANALTFESLLGGMGAFRVGETLARTGGFGAKVVRHRLLETAQYIVQVCRTVEGMKPGGEGNLACVRVRLLHSVVRLKMMSLIKEDPNYYDLEKYGLPINDLDSFGTINTFSSTVIWMGLPRQGINLTDQEQEDYIALWRLVAYYMGAPTEPFESAHKARVASESLLVTEFVPTDTGRMLAKNIAIGMENTAPAYASKEYMDALTRLLNGDQLSDELHVPQTSFYYRMLLWGYLLFVQIEANTIPKIPIIDRFMINVRRKRMWKQIMDEKDGLGKESIYSFKYIPSLKRKTREGTRKQYTFKRPGVEVLSYLGLLTALASIVTVGSGLYVGGKIVIPFTKEFAPRFAQTLMGRLANFRAALLSQKQSLPGVAQLLRASSS